MSINPINNSISNQVDNVSKGTAGGKPVETGKPNSGLVDALKRTETKSMVGSPNGNVRNVATRDNTKELNALIDEKADAFDTGGMISLIRQKFPRIDAVFGAAALGNSNAFFQLKDRRSTLLDSEGKSLFMRALQGGNKEIIECSLDPTHIQIDNKYISQYEYIDKSGNTILIAAAQRCNYSTLEDLCNRAFTHIKKEEIINKGNMIGSTPLMEAAKFENLDAMEFFIGLGADVNKKDISGETALTAAYKTKNHKAICMLIDNGAKISDIKSEEDQIKIMDILNSQQNYTTLKK